LLTSNGIPGVTIYLRSPTGTLLSEHTRPVGWRGIHRDVTDNTFWGVIPSNDTIKNFRISGSGVQIISSGNPAEPVKGLDGMTVDPRDGSLWAPGDLVGVENLNHYARALDGFGHHVLLGSFDTTLFVTVAKDICFDSSDNTIWLADSTAKTIWHVSPDTGLEIAGSLDLVALGYGPGVAITCLEYSAQDNTLYVGDTTTGIYHMTKAGVLLDTITLPDHLSGLASLTLT
jgi:hypothetical protein